MPRNVIVLGAARSGTSLTASLFARHGYFVDDEAAIVEPNHENPTGFWESRNLLRLNERILRDAGFQHDNTWRYERITKDQVAALKTVVLGDEYRQLLERFALRSPWVWKDPRLCYTLGNWWPLLAKQRPVVILVRRDAEAIFNSYVRIGWHGNSARQRQEGYARIREHIKHALETIDAFQIPYCEICYENFQTNPESIVRAINAMCELDLEPDDLGYDDRFNHNRFSARVASRIDKAVSTLPTAWIHRIKRFVPEQLLRKLYPERYR